MSHYVYSDNVYDELKTRYNLKWRQRDLLDSTPNARLIDQAARDGHWATVEALLRAAGIL